MEEDYLLLGDTESLPGSSFSQISHSHKETEPWTGEDHSDQADESDAWTAREEDEKVIQLI